MSRVEDALEWFQYRGLWTLDRTFFVFAKLDEYKFGEDDDVDILKERLKEDKDRLLAEAETLDFLKDYRKKNKIPKEKFWWYVEKL